MEILNDQDSMNKISEGQAARNPVDPALEAFLKANSVTCAGADPKRPGYLRWARRPLGNGDSTTYVFSIPATLRQDGYFLISIMDAIHEAGFQAGRATIQQELQTALGILSAEQAQKFGKTRDI